MTTITRDNFTAAMRQAVAERGTDWRYPQYGEPGWKKYRNETGNPVYSTADGEPACLIGYALHLIAPELMPGHDRRNDSYVILGELGVTDDLLLTAARLAQSAQDFGHSWGAALRDYGADLGFSPQELDSWIAEAEREHAKLQLRQNGGWL